MTKASPLGRVSCALGFIARNKRAQLGGVRADNMLTTAEFGLFADQLYYDFGRIAALGVLIKAHFRCRAQLVA